MASTGTWSPRSTGPSTRSRPRACWIARPSAHRLSGDSTSPGWSTSTSGSTSGSSGEGRSMAGDVSGGGERFSVGINYWPARTAMGWWSAFDAEEVMRDFGRIATNGFDSVRFFLLWEAFQPVPTRVDHETLG